MSHDKGELCICFMSQIAGPSVIALWPALRFSDVSPSTQHCHTARTTHQGLKCNSGWSPMHCIYVRLQTITINLPAWTGKCWC